MDLRAIANGISSQINPNTDVELRVSNGFTVGAGMKQVPAYIVTTGKAQIQALDGADLRQLDGLNITGTTRAIYLRGALHGVIRPENKGGDLVIFGGQTWLVVKVLEHWANWSKAAICLQQA